MCAFTFNMGLTGLWLGTSSSALVCSTSYAVLIAKTDWPKLLHEVKARMQAKIDKKKK
jgi:Na+-driven multidrug efflux pump